MYVILIIFLILLAVQRGSFPMTQTVGPLYKKNVAIHTKKRIFGAIGLN